MRQPDLDDISRHRNETIRLSAVLDLIGSTAENPRGHDDHLAASDLDHSHGGTNEKEKAERQKG
jgi:hypothetical protein